MGSPTGMSGFRPNSTRVDEERNELRKYFSRNKMKKSGVAAESAISWLFCLPTLVCSDSPQMHLKSQKMERDATLSENVGSVLVLILMRERSLYFRTEWCVSN